jgi:hypothetical protein
MKEFTLGRVENPLRMRIGGLLHGVRNEHHPFTLHRENRQRHVDRPFIRLDWTSYLSEEMTHTLPPYRAEAKSYLSASCGH